jgi:hypothetical protein
MALIEIEERIAQALRAQADVREMTLEAFLQRIAETATPINSTPEFALADFDKSVDEASSEWPVLPPAFSRSDIYSDHD